MSRRLVSTRNGRPKGAITLRAVRTNLITTTATVLIGGSIVLRPLCRRDLGDLSNVPDDPAWDLLLRRPAGAGATPDAWFADALRGVRRGSERCWTIRDIADDQLLGSTRFLNLDRANQRLEIGATWLLQEARGSVANAESKLLLLDHAFGDLGMRRVHIQADVRNARSRRAIEALGATFEGVLRQHIVMSDGTSRDTAIYSILADEWPDLRTALAARIAHGDASWRQRPSSLLTPTDAIGWDAAPSACAPPRAALA